MAPLIRAAGGVPMMWKTGHSLVKAKMREIGAPLAGEMSGHIFFGERWYGFDDATYTAARLLEILSASADPSAVLNALPTSFSTPELNVPCAEGEPAEVVARLRAEAKFPGAREVVTIDGVRVEYDDGFGLVRASNTTPVLVLRFEGTTPEALARIEADCMAALRAVKPDAQRRGGRALNASGRTRRALARGRAVAHPDRQAVVARRRRPCAAGRRRHPRRLSAGADRLGRRARHSRRCCSASHGIAEVIECPLRRWTRAGLWRPSVAARDARLRAAPAARALRRDRRPAGPDQVGA